MNLPITTPALLFPAISLLFLSYNGRFLTLSNLIRGMHAEYHKAPDERILAQMRNFKIRLQLIRWMQWLAMVSFILGTITMFLLYVGLQLVGEVLFGISLVFLVASLGFSLREIHISINALKVLIGDIL
ncbi:MAG: DUF2721 domain-containing protein [Fibrobacterota bacterium]|nr:DUF2721 domain-containing protein [Fibrobacterota bacterium]QQS04288.1 MAG: DUF2721 domain-containing protein [Fibrobacterota bacterium]